jgi:drug/metabolite transporter (DMT)-like permease
LPGPKTGEEPTPIIGIAASAVIFGDKLGLLFLLGVIFVLCGLALTMMSRAPTSEEPSMV